MTRDQKATVRRLIWADRCNRIRVALDSFWRRGRTTVKAGELAKVVEVPESAVRRIGLTMADKVQPEDGRRVRYSAAFFFLDPKDR